MNSGGLEPIGALVKRAQSGGLESVGALAVVLALVLVPSTAAAQLLDPPEGLVEASRDIDIEVRYGLALVTTRVVLESDAPLPVEAHLRIAVPHGAGLASLRVCAAGTCREGVAADARPGYETARASRRFSPRPIAVASIGDRQSDPAVEIRAMPIVGGHPFELTVRYVARATLRDGTVTFELPPQGGSGLDGPIRVTARGPELESVTVNGSARPVTLAGAASATVRARVPEGAARAVGWSVRCGNERCIRFRVAAGPVSPRPRDVFVLLDVSPSVRHAPQGRRARALNTLLTSLHRRSRIVRVAFARRADRLDATPLAPETVPVDQPLPYLGNRTSIAAALALFQDDLRRAIDPLVVLIGDGALSTDADSRAALQRVVDSGAELSLVSIAERHTESALADAILSTAGASVRAFDAQPGRTIRSLAAPLIESDVRLGRRSRGPLRAGEELVFEARHRGGPTPTLRALGRTIRAVRPRRFWAAGLATRLALNDPRSTLVAISPDQRAAAQRAERVTWGGGLEPRQLDRRPYLIRCYGQCGGRVRGAISRAELVRVRARLRPAVTACFASSRAGRRAWRSHATLRLVLRYAELISATVPQSSDPRLARCLAGVADEFDDLPFSEDRVTVNFRFRSDAAEPFAAEAPTAALERALDDIGVR